MNCTRTRWKSTLPILAFIGVVLFWWIGCSDDASTRQAPTPLLVFADMHFTPFYDPEIFFDLVNTSPDHWPRIFEGASITEPQSWGKETNYPLFVRMLEAARQASQSSPLVLFPGDILSHKFRETFFGLYGEEDETALRAFVYKTCSFFTDQVRAYLADRPVLFVLGNNDAYAGDYKLIPGGEFLADTAELFYSTLLLKETDFQTFRTSYEAGGYYAAQPSGSKVLFVCLSTVLFSVNWSSEGHEDAPMRQLDWLATTLAHAKAQEKRVWILMHVPPGADVYATVADYMDDAGRISDAHMMWKKDYQKRFLEIIRPYRDTIETCFAGHTHVDEFRIMFYEDGHASETLLISPAVSPQYGNNPGFKVFTLSMPEWVLQDYRSITYPFQMPDPAFDTYYTFSSSYSVGGALEPALNDLVPEMVQDDTKRTAYSRFYYSGHDEGNPINSTNWPAYWCATHNMAKDDYIRCVNSY